VTAVQSTAMTDASVRELLIQIVRDDSTEVWEVLRHAAVHLTSSS
jgi:hypothetical protein